MPKGVPFLFIPALTLLWLASGSPTVAEEGEEALVPISYNQQIRPILSNNCFPCHGPDSAARKAGLRLDNAEDAYRGISCTQTGPY